MPIVVIVNGDKIIAKGVPVASAWPQTPFVVISSTR